MKDHWEEYYAAQGADPEAASLIGIMVVLVLVGAVCLVAWAVTV